MNKSILESIAYNFKGNFPKEELKEIIKEKDKHIPELLKVLEYTNENAEKVSQDEDYILHLYALYLLAQFKVKEAYPLVIELINNEEDIVEGLLGDVITEGLGRILASVCNKDLDPLKSTIENETLYEYIRVAALRALGILALHNELDKNEFKAYINSLFTGKLERKPSAFWDELVNICSDFQLKEMKEHILKVYDEDLIEPFTVNLEDVEEAFAISEEQAINELKANHHFEFIEDTIEELKWWNCFKNTDRNFNNSLAYNTIQKSEKVGRNDPCPCGSGKKYKKCCSS